MEYEIDDDPQDHDGDRCEANRTGGVREDHLLHTRSEHRPRKANQAAPPSHFRLKVADRVGFEPTVGVNPRRFSRPLP
jgi:hypothetical protein